MSRKMLFTIKLIALICIRSIDSKVTLEEIIASDKYHNLVTMEFAFEDCISGLETTVKDMATSAIESGDQGSIKFAYEILNLTYRHRVNKQLSLLYTYAYEIVSKITKHTDKPMTIVKMEKYFCNEHAILNVINRINKRINKKLRDTINEPLGAERLKIASIFKNVEEKITIADITLLLEELKNIYQKKVIDYCESNKPYIPNKDAFKWKYERVYQSVTRPEFTYVFNVSHDGKSYKETINEFVELKDEVASEY